MTSEPVVIPSRTFLTEFQDPLQFVLGTNCTSGLHQRTAPWVARSGEQQLDEIRSRHVMVASDVVQDRRERTEADGSVTRHGDVMLPVHRSGEAHVAAGLPRLLITEALQCACELLS